jgi:hypothetical protein
MPQKGNVQAYCVIGPRDWFALRVLTILSCETVVSKPGDNLRRESGERVFAQALKEDFLSALVRDSGARTLGRCYLCEVAKKRILDGKAVG